MIRREYEPMVAYDLPLRPTLLIRLTLPVNFTPEEAERLCGIIRSLALARSLDGEQTTDPRPSLVSPCPVCGFADWPEGGMHAAKSIHLLAHERARDFDVEQTKEQEET